MLETCTLDMAAACGEFHCTERRQSPSTCCCWLAAHCQRIHRKLSGIQNHRSLVAHENGRPGIIFRGTGKPISHVDKAAWHPVVDVEFQGCAWADSDCCTRWVDKTFKAIVTGGSGVKPAEQSILFADNLHGNKTEELRKN